MKPTTVSNDLSSDLASLRISRDPEAPPATRRPTRYVWLAAIALVIATGAALLFAFRGRLSPKSTETAVVASIQPGEEPPLFVATGTVTAPTTDVLAPRTPGRLLKRLVEEGQSVAAGEAVAELDPTDLRLALNQATADLASAQARVETARVAEKSAEIKATRAQNLFKTSAGTESAAVDAGLDLDSARAQLRVAVADLGQAQARLETARRNLAETILRAPFRAVVVKVLAQPGDFVSTAPGQGVVQLADLSSLEVDAEVAEANLRQVTLRMPVEVRLDALANQGLVGHVFSIRPNVDVAKATAIVKVQLDSSMTATGLPLFPGMNGRVTFLAHEPNAQALSKAPMLEVPAVAVLHEGGETQVLTVDKDGHVKAEKIVTAGADGDRMVLKEGPPAGTTIVARPDGIKSGDRIQQSNN
jgi:RND family efflux transporter MFP subunit